MKRIILAALVGVLVKRKTARSATRQGFCLGRGFGDKGIAAFWARDVFFLEVIVRRATALAGPFFAPFRFCHPSSSFG